MFDGDFQVAHGLTGRRAHKSALLDVGVRNAVASAVNPVRGRDGLVALVGHDLRLDVERVPALRDRHGLLHVRRHALAPALIHHLSAR